MARAGGDALSVSLDRFGRGVETPRFEQLLPAAELSLRESPPTVEGADGGERIVPERAGFGRKTKA